ncbi:hypothetical protein [Gluconobacter wancherniae]|uniref:Lipoprotein n=1 Tax=Gluconobacter wancherniae NBRC 103581 TaxID=656744 RepID=A0A511AYR3_9PROT|nr:hypothetical protein [Gluconobacter wancherniae]MBF0853481.1 hypothetical protein [Gluconobacter wancherniae]MBS1063281.1 hypothetical protein [Gluconobacter wancherniae]MBS1088301.1 hypothetical protein [Gluconobacter wancherniae]MBS1093986.1 hypothetical protein [Gluconobacter wancherniae]GEK93316.1 hypothetical protein GWA01_10860 [Gluconobacter wancherniae NBRC 103581]
MNKKRLIWIVLSGALMTLFFLTACMTTTMDAAGHVHANIFWMAGFVIFSLVHIYCTCMSR